MLDPVPAAQSGYLVDVTYLAMRAGWSCDVALTQGAWVACQPDARLNWRDQRRTFERQVTMVLTGLRDNGAMGNFYADERALEVWDEELQEIVDYRRRAPVHRFIWNAVAEGMPDDRVIVIDVAGLRREALT